MPNSHCRCQKSLPSFSANTTGRHIDDAWVSGKWANAQGGQIAWNTRERKKIIFFFNVKAAVLAN